MPFRQEPIHPKGPGVVIIGGREGRGGTRNGESKWWGIRIEVAVVEVCKSTYHSHFALGGESNQCTDVEESSCTLGFASML